MVQGIAAVLGGSSVLMVGAGEGTRVGGIGQSFLVTNRFSEANPALGQGVPCLTGAFGMSSSGRGLEFCVSVDGHGTFLNFPVARLYTVTSMDSVADLVTGVWVLTVATVGAGAVEVGMEDTGWVSTLTLYPLLAIMVLFLLSLALVPGVFLTLGLVLGWDSCGWVCCDGSVLTGLGAGAWALDQASLLALDKFSYSG